MKRRLPFDGALIAVVLLLVGFGLVMVFSASATISQDRYGSASGILFRQMLAAMLGLVALWGAMKVDYKIYARREVTLPLVLLTIGMLLLAILTSGGRWIHVGPVQFQPSELAKLTAILFTAYYLARRETDLTSFSHGVLPSVGVTAVLIVLVLGGRDLGTAACIGLVVGLLLFLAGLRYRHLLVLGMGGVSVFGLMILVEPYRWERIVAFFNPGQDPSGADYQITQSVIALGSGGISGIGLGDSIQKLYFLPEAHTDFIFAVVGEELGLLGCLVLMTLFGLFMWRGLIIAERADSPLGTYLGIGIVWMVVVQAVINMSVVVRFLPTTGIPLPFISVGGSSLMVMLAASGILLNISKHRRPN